MAKQHFINATQFSHQREKLRVAILESYPIQSNINDPKIVGCRRVIEILF